MWGLLYRWSNYPEHGQIPSKYVPMQIFVLEGACSSKLNVCYISTTGIHERVCLISVNPLGSPNSTSDLINPRGERIISEV